MRDELQIRPTYYIVDMKCIHVLVGGTMENNGLYSLIVKATQNDETAFSELCAKKGKDILYICIQLMGNLHDGEDAAQEVLIAMQKSICNLKAPEAFSSWLYKLTLNVCNEQRRKTLKYKYNSPLEDYENVFPDEALDSLPQEYTEHGEKNEQLVAIIKKLPYNYRVSVLLFYYEGMSYAEIAQAMGTTSRAVANYLLRARKKIKQELKINDAVDGKAGTNANMLAFAPAMTQILRMQMDAEVSTDMVVALLQNTPAADSVAKLLSKVALPKGRSAQIILTACAMGAVVYVLLFNAFTTGTPDSKDAHPHPESIVATSQKNAASIPDTEQKDPATSPNTASQNAASENAASGSQPGQTANPPQKETLKKPPNPSPNTDTGKPPTPPPTTETATQQAHITGAVELENKDGTFLENSEQYTKGMRVSLLQNQVQLATATVQSNGCYTFYDLPAGNYSVRLEPALAGDVTANNAVQVSAKANETATAPTLIGIDTVAPTVAVVLLNFDDEVSAVNPTSCKVFVGDALPTSYSCTIQNKAGELFAQGTLEAVNEFLLSAYQGECVLKIIAEDAAGNTTQRQLSFYKTKITLQGE